MKRDSESRNTTKRVRSALRWTFVAVLLLLVGVGTYHHMVGN
ncbi:hypothetical protein [Variovorax saccharolyticus]|nr:MULTISPECIES: hypothetical protein [unclassified Variovorax]MDM0019450.1 hypothetical protein [Variovorax sp. J22R187]MDM0026328.1 hypothetical protein [Variovorax sp. J31P216]